MMPTISPKLLGLFPKEYLARKRKNPGRIGYLLRVYICVFRKYDQCTLIILNYINICKPTASIV